MSLFADEGFQGVEMLQSESLVEGTRGERRDSDMRNIGRMEEFKDIERCLAEGRKCDISQHQQRRLTKGRGIGVVLVEEGVVLVELQLVQLKKRVEEEKKTVKNEDEERR